MQIEREGKGSAQSQPSPASPSDCAENGPLRPDGCTCHPDFSSQGSPLEGPCEHCSSSTASQALDPKSWEVSISLEGQNILTIAHNHLSGLSDIERYGDVVRSCAEHLMSFIGSGEPGPCFFCGVVECACPPPPSDHVGGEG